ncbi:type II toxin-antitoxin system VapC family toxin [Sphingomonas sp. PB4P5]|uniref:type II toxin-antitoxin system VapC family toxin n=1 Tax=Parasphingomonas puruogangriensis TaxID=3096155 RepID=UPI002FC72ABD
MTTFVDASALVAIIGDEPDGDHFAQIVRDTDDLIWSAMSCWETISALRCSHEFGVERARREVSAVANRAGLVLVAIGSDELDWALDAYLRYGRGRHPAKLNMGDCFAYACAKANNAKLLYKGNDFAQTDLA